MAIIDTVWAGAAASVRPIARIEKISPMTFMMTTTICTTRNERRAIGEDQHRYQGGNMFVEGTA